MTKHYQQSNQSEWRVYSELSRREIESLKEFTSKTVKQLTDQISEKGTINFDPTSYYQKQTPREPEVWLISAKYLDPRSPIM